ncbi:MULTISPECIES: hypothetical protein [Paenibacillus]|uniref:hypothetical protein n=1 Tax=Paenibacillus TaxID=44249 RepID=UPI001180F511|nr:hypothetical protein [Paenibacillus odorifer]
MSIDVFFIVCDSLQAAILLLLEDRCFAFLAVVTASCNTFLFWTNRCHRIVVIRRPIPPNHDHPLRLSDSNDVIRKYIAIGARFRTPVQLFI